MKSKNAANNLNSAELVELNIRNLLGVCSLSHAIASIAIMHGGIPLAQGAEETSCLMTSHQALFYGRHQARKR